MTNYQKMKFTGRRKTSINKSIVVKDKIMGIIKLKYSYLTIRILLKHQIKCLNHTAREEISNSS